MAQSLPISSRNGVMGADLKIATRLKSSSHLPRRARPGPGGADVIQKEAWPFYRTISGVRLCWELEEPKGSKGLWNSFMINTWQCSTRDSNSSSIAASSTCMRKTTGYEPFRPTGYEPFRPTGYEPCGSRGYEPFGPRSNEPFTSADYEPWQQMGNRLRAQLLLHRRLVHLHPK